MLVRDSRPAVTARATAGGAHARARLMLALAVVLSALLPALLAPTSRPASAHHTGIVLPFAEGAEWVVSQGYNTSPAEGWSHYNCNPRTGKDEISRSTRCDPGWQYKYSFDLRRADGDEAGERVLSPATGVVSWVDRAYGGFALDLGDGYAVAVFHLDLAREIEVGRELRAGQRIGNVAGPGGGGNGGTPHIHLTLWKTDDAGNSSRQAVPFDGAHPLEGMSFPAGRDRETNQHLGATLVSSNRADAPSEVPAAPVLLAPDDGAAFPGARDVPAFAWEPVLDADEYQVVLNDGERTGPWLPRTRWNPGDLAPGEWTWQVRARNDAGEGPLSAPRSLTIDDPVADADANDATDTETGTPVPASATDDADERAGDDSARDESTRDDAEADDRGDRDADADDADDAGDRGGDDRPRDRRADEATDGGDREARRAEREDRAARDEARADDRDRPEGGTGRVLDRADLLRDRAGVPSGPPASTGPAGTTGPAGAIRADGATGGASDGESGSSGDEATASGDGDSARGDGTASATDGDVTSGSDGATDGATDGASGEPSGEDRANRRRAKDDPAGETAADGTTGGAAAADGALQTYEGIPRAQPAPAADGLAAAAIADLTGNAPGAGADPAAGGNPGADANPAAGAGPDEGSAPEAGAGPARQPGAAPDAESEPASDAGTAGTDGNLSSGEEPPDLPRGVVNLLPNPGVYGIDPDARPNRDERREERREAAREDGDAATGDDPAAEPESDDDSGRDRRSSDRNEDDDSGRDENRGHDRDDEAAEPDSDEPEPNADATPIPDAAAPAADPSPPPAPEAAPAPTPDPPPSPEPSTAPSPAPDLQPTPTDVAPPEPTETAMAEPAPEPTPEPTPAPDAGATAAPRDLVFLPVADTSVDAASPDEPQPPAQASVLPLGGPDQATAYVTFAVEGIAPGKVVSAQLTVTGAIGFWGPVSVAVAPGYAVDEASLTWNTAPGRERPAAAADGSPAAIPGLPNAEEVTVDVTGAVDGDGFVTFVLRGTPDAGQAIGSRESGIPARLSVTVGG